ncbi:YppG family protein [Lentibacillus juripiscarius]|uniref:YppG family protein n=1 Tax=Lentibacillus juripiscarius TaxID=257446 RepID=A0ABW5V7P4_9BACI
MYPDRPRRPMPPPRPPHPPMGRPRPPMQQQSPVKQNLINQFRDSEGNLDIDKITHTAQQVGKLYSQVSPLFSKFKKK